MNSELLNQPIPKIPTCADFHYQFEDATDDRPFVERLMARQVVLGVGIAKSAAESLGKRLEDLTTRELIDFSESVANGEAVKRAMQRS